MAEEYMSNRQCREKLETGRCAMMPLQKTDYQEMKQLYMNQEVRKYLGGVRTEDDFQQIFEEMIDSREEYHWVIRTKDSKEFVGFLSLGLHHDGFSHEVSYQLLPEWWGNGYGIDAVRAVLDYAFDVLRLSKIIAETQTSNLPSRKLLERAGMREEQRLVRFGAEQIIYEIEGK